MYRFCFTVTFLFLNYKNLRATSTSLFSYICYSIRFIYVGYVKLKIFFKLLFFRVGIILEKHQIELIRSYILSF